jgi:hypothetical protein
MIMKINQINMNKDLVWKHTQAKSKINFGLCMNASASISAPHTDLVLFGPELSLSTNLSFPENLKPFGISSETALFKVS